MLRLRALGIDAIPQILAWQERCLLTQDHRQRHAWRRLLADRPDRMWGLETTLPMPCQLVAAILWHIQGRIARILVLGVDPDWRRQGLATTLLDHAAVALPLQVDTLSLEVDVANRGAAALYRAHGFRATYALPDYYGPGRDGLRMRAPRWP